MRQGLEKGNEIPPRSHQMNEWIWALAKQIKLVTYMQCDLYLMLRHSYKILKHHEREGGVLRIIQWRREGKLPQGQII